MKNEKWDDVHGNTTPDDRMVAFLESPTDSYAILQLREDVDDNIPLMFANYSYLQKKEMEPEIDRYEVVYHGSISMSEDVNRQLYPNAEIKVAGFETTDRRDFYDLAVGNVPFGNYKVSDKPYDKLGFSIHNYFFAKALDQVRPGGVVAFVTSRYTMDSKNSDARRYMAQRAELLGAIRLPNDAFKKNAGTEVVSDILFLQKRDHPIDIVPEWVNLDRTEEGHTMNSYQTGFAGCESPGFAPANLLQQPEPVRKASERNRQHLSC